MIDLRKLSYFKGINAKVALYSIFFIILIFIQGCLLLNIEIQNKFSESKVRVKFQAIWVTPERFFFNISIINFHRFDIVITNLTIEMNNFSQLINEFPSVHIRPFTHYRNKVILNRSSLNDRLDEAVLMFLVLDNLGNYQLICQKIFRGSEIRLSENFKLP